MRFEYLEPESIDEALGMLSRYHGKAKIIAGGTDLMLQIRYKQVRPEYVIDITRIPDLDNITFEGRQGLKLGALTTIRALETSAQVQERYPIVSQAAGQLGSVAIRNVATVGGNLCNALPSAETLSGPGRALRTGEDDRTSGRTDPAAGRLLDRRGEDDSSTRRTPARNSYS